MLKTGEIKEMDETQMKERLLEMKKELFNLRFQNDIGQLENTAKLSEVKKDIARLYTVSRQMNVNIG
ncbi:MAG: 50S ribosomal protein L29 [Desulfotignum sp.]|mgnify:FL=1|jgi:large subunit ribosomal protein L29|nr:50S ribosomal protein L29 [Desulfotignum sp.]